jgi:hypothetical protein
LRVAQKDTNAAVARSQRRRSGNGLGALAPAGPYQSPAPQPAAQQHQVSPYINVSPQVYSSPFSSPTAYSPINTSFGYGGYGGYGSPMYATATSQAYYGAQYPLAYYPSSPTYNTGGSATSSPVGQYFYYPYQQAYAFNPTVGQGAFSTYGQPAFNTGAPAQDDRSSTPTPAGRDSEFESLGSQ